MKKIAIVLGVVGLTIFSCTESKVEENVNTPIEEVVVTQEEPSDIVDGVVRNSVVKWTGFKTTEKLAVSGTFEAVQVTDTKEGTTPEQVLQGAKVRVAVSSINSGAEDRDGKLKMILFGTMANTSYINGVINFKGGKTFITFTLNNVSKEYEVASKFENNVFTINTTLDLANFNANSAVEALNTACADLHKGADGITKTWSEVEIEGSIEFAEDFGK
ncbi:YceI family protein [Faecalibacter bovis]|uniref:YceI family protein n=1 Tax=Faecalibacter bovis TaxID=2898187 RepID=A0ABX7XDI1_9FLAO|nr:YceI family protein [Faecalibacter bovis]QTV05950.1 YceI family protein [Faecalibacter bovis]